MAEAKAPNTDIVVLDDSQVELALRGELALEGIQVAIEDPQKVQLDIIARILTSEDADEVFRGQQAISGREALERPFTLHAVRWHKSKFAEGLPVFAVMDAAFLDNGERAAITSSAGNVMAQAFTLHKLNALPENVKLVESDHETAGGFKPQWLVRA